MEVLFSKEAREARIDYAVTHVKPHPRLFVENANDFKALAKRLENSKLGKLARERLLFECDAILDFPVLERVMEGRRLLTISRCVLNRVGKLALAYRLTDDTRYLNRAVAEMMAVASFTDWNPSHFLDVAEMTFGMAVGYDWLYDAMSVADRTVVRDAIVRLGLTTGDGKTPFSGWWVASGNNWGQVCNAGECAGAMAVMEDEPELARHVIDQAVRGLPEPMKAFAPAGGFPEGPAAYWGYALEYNTIAIELLDNVCGTDFGLSSLPGFAAQADYLDLMTGSTGVYFNFSDAGVQSISERISESPVWWFAKRYNRPDILVWQEIPAFKKYINDRSAITPVMRRTYDRLFFLSLLWFQEPPVGMTEPTSPLCRLLDGINPVSVQRTGWKKDDTFVGLKGGLPKASHGHMDTGSFVLDMKGVRWSYDLGCEDYATIEAAKIDLWNHSQDAQRWTLFRYSTEGHSTIQLDGMPQNVGNTARFLEFTDSVPSVAKLDMKPVYEPLAERFTRTSRLEADGCVTLTDEISGCKPGTKAVWRMNTKADAIANGNKLSLMSEGRQITLAAAPDDVCWHITSVEAPRSEAEGANPGMKQVWFEYNVPDNGNLKLSVIFV